MALPIILSQQALHIQKTPRGCFTGTPRSCGGRIRNNSPLRKDIPQSEQA